MRVKFQREASPDAFTVTHDAVRLERPEDVAEWRAQLMSEAEAAVGKGRAYLLIDYTGFSVSPRVAESYGQVAEDFRLRFAREVFRYGVADQDSSTVAILQSIKRSHLSNVFATREEALQALQRARGVR